jgi:lysophospholipase L1-like esterase
MKKVILLGDSIRAGYCRVVRAELEGKAEVIFAEGDNGRFTVYTLWQLGNLLKQHGKVDVIHFNNGYWDMETLPFTGEKVLPIDEYTYYLKRIIKLARAAGARVIFATTTPLPADSNAEDNTGTGAKFSLEKDSVIAYNNAALKVMEEENVPVNDLYALAKQDARYYKCEDNLHHTVEGNKVLGKAVADIVLKELEKI